MRRCLIDINDAGIRVSDASGLVTVSPGFAFLHQGALLTGASAAARIRTNPRAGSDKFWHQLSQAPLPRPLGPARSHADLAWYHLRDLWAPLAADYDEVLLSVSADYDAERLSTLLGIARACDIPVRSVVAAAALAAASHLQQDAAARGAGLIYVDAQWHQLTLEPVQTEAGRVSVIRTGSSPQQDVVRHGVAALHDRWAHMIAEAFLQRTRFDPLHNAASEQQLYDALPQWLQQLSLQPSIPLALNSGSHDFSIELDREAFRSTAADLYQPLLSLAERRQQPLLLRQQMTLLPGLIEQLREHTEVDIVADDKISDYLQHAAATLISDDADEVRHHLSLLLDASASSRPEHPAAKTSSQPTHISDGTSLWALDTPAIGLPPVAAGAEAVIEGVHLRRHDDGRITLQPGADVQLQAALRINQQSLPPEQPQQLSAGDRISLGEQHFQLLRLVPVSAD